MKALIYLHKYGSSSQKVELTWPKRMLSPDLEMSNVRLGLLMTYAASVAIFPRFHPSKLPRAAPSARRGIFKALLNGCLRMHFESLFERDLETAVFAPGGEQPGSAPALQPSESPGPNLFTSPRRLLPLQGRLRLGLLLTLFDDFLQLTLHYSSSFIKDPGFMTLIFFFHSINYQPTTSSRIWLNTSLSICT